MSPFDFIYSFYLRKDVMMHINTPRSKGSQQYSQESHKGGGRQQMTVLKPRNQEIVIESFH